MIVRMGFVIPRDGLLSANDRGHWSVAAKKVKVLRTTGWAEGRRIGARLDLAHLTVTVSWPDSRRRDVANISPTVKALVDGIVSAGLLPDDSDTYLIGPDLRVADTPSRSGFVSLLFEFEGLDQ